MTMADYKVFKTGCEGAKCPNLSCHEMGGISYFHANKAIFRGSKFVVIAYSAEFTQITNSDLRDTHIERVGGSDLSGSNLRGAVIKLIDSDAPGSVKLSGSDLRGATVVEILNLDSVDFTGAIYDSASRLPFGDKEATARGMIKK
jgi:uncharacterized protein YjbI with pentapeptide repeats